MTTVSSRSVVRRPSGPTTTTCCGRSLPFPGAVMPPSCPVPGGTERGVRIALGHGDQEADAHLETALAEFRAIGERWGMSFALHEKAVRASVALSARLRDTIAAAGSATLALDLTPGKPLQRVIDDIAHPRGARPFRSGRSGATHP